MDWIRKKRQSVAISRTGVFRSSRDLLGGRSTPTAPVGEAALHVKDLMAEFAKLRAELTTSFSTHHLTLLERLMTRAEKDPVSL